MLHRTSRRRHRRGSTPTSLLVALLLVLGGAACSGAEDEGSGAASTSPTNGVTTTTTAGAAGAAGSSDAAEGSETLDDLLEPTRKVTSAHFELRRHLGMPGERVVEIIEGDYDRTANAVSYVQRFEASELFRAQLAAASPGAGPVEDLRIHTVRVGGLVFVGPSTVGVPPPTWLRYDDAAYRRLVPEIDADIANSPLAPLLDAIEHRDGASVRRGRRLVFDAGPRTTFEAAAAPASVVFELGSRFVRTTSVGDFLDELDADVPLTLELDDDGVLHTLFLDATALYGEVAQKSGIAAVRQAARQVTAVRSELRLTAHGKPVVITPPDPAKVQPA